MQTSWEINRRSRSTCALPKTVCFTHLSICMVCCFCRSAFINRSARLGSADPQKRVSAYHVLVLIYSRDRQVRDKYRPGHQSSPTRSTRSISLCQVCGWIRYSIEINGFSHCALRFFSATRYDPISLTHAWQRYKPETVTVNKRRAGRQRKGRTHYLPVSLRAWLDSCRFH